MEPGLSGLEQQAALLPRVASHDLPAFDALYQRYAPLLYGLLLRILRQEADAEEVLQETFVQVWNRARMYDPSRGTEAAFLISMARNRAIDRLRSRNTRDAKELEAAQPVPVQSETADPAVVAQQRDAVRRALAALPEAQRKALELAYFEGMTQSEIAARLGEPLGTVKTRLLLGMRKLREALEWLK